MNKNDRHPKIILLATACDLTNIVYAHVSEKYQISAVIIEKNISKKTLLKNRIKKIGFLNVLGQVLFIVLITKLLKKISSKRICDILRDSKLHDAAIPNEKIISVVSINSKEVIDLIKCESPDFIIVNGTRIISQEVLSSSCAPFINIHAGITPLYRGVHGAYWALVNKDSSNCGVTVHFIDKGVDTGGILAQDVIIPTSEDNFATYPYLQFSKGVNLLVKVIDQFCLNSISEIKGPKGASMQWYHPTIWHYLYYRICKGVD